MPAPGSVARKAVRDLEMRWLRELFAPVAGIVTPDRQPVYFISWEDGTLRELEDFDASLIDRIVRVEIWVQTCDQYVLVYKEDAGEWLPPEMGEYPHARHQPESLSEIVMCLDPSTNEGSVLPVLASRFRDFRSGYLFGLYSTAVPADRNILWMNGYAKGLLERTC